MCNRDTYTKAYESTYVIGKYYVSTYTAQCLHNNTLVVYYIQISFDV